MSPSGPSQSVLFLPELLSRILEFLDDEDYASTALVCKAWSEESLNLFWDEVLPPKFPTLLKLLAPIAKGTNDLWMFVRPLHTKDWSRFNKYATRVRNLGLSPLFMDEVDSSLWLEIASTKPRRHIFPNLYNLDCTPQPAVISFLASSHLRTMTLIGLGTHFSPITLKYALLHIQSRMRSLQSFTLAIDESEFAKIHPVLPKLLRGFSHVRRLSVSQEYLTPAVTNLLASFPHLERLEGDLQNGMMTVIPTRMFPESLEKGSFPVLESLEVCVPFSNIIPCLPGMASLVDLTLTSFEAESAEVYSQIFQAVASALPKLETLDLTPSETSLTSSDYDHIKFSAIKPLLALKKLRNLSIHYYHPLDINCDDVITLLQGLPQLEQLRLNPCPPSDCGPTLDGTDLLKIAPYCQRLEMLGLYLDLSVVPTYDEPVFLPSLVRFIYGASHLPSDDTVPVAAFLSRLLPEGCQLSREWWHDDDDFVDWSEVIRLVHRSTSSFTLISTTDALLFSWAEWREGATLNYRSGHIDGLLTGMMVQAIGSTIQRFIQDAQLRV